MRGRRRGAGKAGQATRGSRPISILASRVLDFERRRFVCSRVVCFSARAASRASAPAPIRTALTPVRPSPSPSPRHLSVQIRPFSSFFSDMASCSPDTLLRHESIHPRAFSGQSRPAPWAPAAIPGEDSLNQPCRLLASRATPHIPCARPPRPRLRLLPRPTALRACPQCHARPFFPLRHCALLYIPRSARRARPPSSSSLRQQEAPYIRFSPRERPPSPGASSLPKPTAPAMRDGSVRSPHDRLPQSSASHSDRSEAERNRSCGLSGPDRSRDTRPQNEDPPPPHCPSSRFPIAPQLMTYSHHLS